MAVHATNVDSAVNKQGALIISPLVSGLLLPLDTASYFRRSIQVVLANFYNPTGGSVVAQNAIVQSASTSQPLDKAHEAYYEQAPLGGGGGDG